MVTRDWRLAGEMHELDIDWASAFYGAPAALVAARERTLKGINFLWTSYLVSIPTWNSILEPNPVLLLVPWEFCCPM